MYVNDCLSFQLEEVISITFYMNVDMYNSFIGDTM